MNTQNLNALKGL